MMAEGGRSESREDMMPLQYTAKKAGAEPLKFDSFMQEVLSDPQQSRSESPETKKPIPSGNLAALYQ